MGFRMQDIKDEMRRKIDNAQLTVYDNSGNNISANAATKDALKSALNRRNRSIGGSEEKEYATPARAGKGNAHQLGGQILAVPQTPAAKAQGNRPKSAISHPISRTLGRKKSATSTRVADHPKADLEVNSKITSQPYQDLQQASGKHLKSPSR